MSLTTERLGKSYPKRSGPLHVLRDDVVTHSAELARLFPRRLEMNDGTLHPL